MSKTSTQNKLRKIQFHAHIESGPGYAAFYFVAIPPLDQQLMLEMKILNFNFRRSFFFEVLISADFTGARYAAARAAADAPDAAYFVAPAQATGSAATGAATNTHPHQHPPTPTTPPTTPPPPVHTHTHTHTRASDAAYPPACGSKSTYCIRCCNTHARTHPPTHPPTHPRTHSHVLQMQHTCMRLRKLDGNCHGGLEDLRIQLPESYLRPYCLRP